MPKQVVVSRKADSLVSGMSVWFSQTICQNCPASQADVIAEDRHSSANAGKQRIEFPVQTLLHL